MFDLVIDGKGPRGGSRSARPRPLRLEPLEGRTLPSNVLVFSRTEGFRHDSIPDGIAAIQRLGADNGFGVDATEDPGAFTDANLGNYQAVVFLLTTGTVLQPDQKEAFQRFIEAGNGYVGVHSAADTEYDWAWYGQLMGAYFQDHPAIQPAEVDVPDHSHPSTAALPDVWPRTDEWYNFRTNPRDNGVTVLATLDESTYSGGTMGADHPIMWYHDFDGGRAWYTGMGHTRESYSEPLFVQSLLGAIQYATGESPTPTAPKPPAPGHPGWPATRTDFTEWVRVVPEAAPTSPTAPSTEFRTGATVYPDRDRAPSLSADEPLRRAAAAAASPFPMAVTARHRQTVRVDEPLGVGMAPDTWQLAPAE
jgi:type 1 glutamine amidotransferase